LPDTDSHQPLEASSLAIGVFIGVVAGLVFMVSMTIFDIEGRLAIDDPEVAAEIDGRIEPVGRVVLLGSAELAAVRAVVVPQPVAAVRTGPQAYNYACINCHSPDSPAAAATGAPTMGNAAAWAGRVEQGMETLIDHAINGYTGDAGFMPAKGGYIDLSDEAVIAAIEYMLDQLPE
jgi:cytochrome c5